MSFKRISRLEYHFTDHRRLHIFEDLRPYQCLVESCPDKERLFESKCKWVEHDLLSHRWSYVCSLSRPCGYQVDSTSAFIKHAWKDHDINLTDERWSHTFEDARFQDLDTSETICELCLKHMPLGLRYDHMADHFEELALSIFPRGLSPCNS